MTSVAMTGHRPKKIANETFLRTQIRNVFEQRPVEYVINGLAAGVDLWSAFEAIKLGIPVWSARPWLTHEPRKEDRKLYDFVIDNSVKVVNVTEYTTYPGPWVYQTRNEWMVDNADKVFAVWDGTSGGTANCFKYAQEQNKSILRYIPTVGWEVYQGFNKIK